MLWISHACCTGLRDARCVRSFPWFVYSLSCLLLSTLAVGAMLLALLILHSTCLPTFAILRISRQAVTACTTTGTPGPLAQPSLQRLCRVCGQCCIMEGSLI